MNTDTNESKEICLGTHLGGVDESIIHLWKNLLLNYFAINTFPGFVNINLCDRNNDDNLILNCEDGYIAQLILDCIKHQVSFSLDYCIEHDNDEEVWKYKFWMKQTAFRTLLELMWKDYEGKDIIINDLYDHIKTIEKNSADGEDIEDHDNKRVCLTNKTLENEIPF